MLYNHSAHDDRVGNETPMATLPSRLGTHQRNGTSALGVLHQMRKSLIECGFVHVIGIRTKPRILECRVA